MITYLFTKDDGANWLYFYDRSIRLWTTYQVDDEGNQITIEADYYNDKKQLKEAHGFDFKSREY